MRRATESSREEEMVMLFIVFLLFFSTIFPASQALFFTFNSSTIPAFQAHSTAFHSPSVPPSPSSKSFLKEVLNAVADKEQWDPDSDARISVVETESARVNSVQSFDFHVRVGRMMLILKFSEEEEGWRKAEKGEIEFGPDLVALHEGYRQGFKVLRLEGPLELHSRGGEEEVSVHLPSLNITHRGLKRVFVGQGVAIEVDSSDEISLFFPYETALALKERSNNHKHSRDQFYPLGFSSCAPMISVGVAGPTSLVAFRVPDVGAHVQTSFPSHDTIKLLPEKCYSNGLYERVPYAASQTLLSKFAVMESVLNTLLGKSIFLDRPSRFLKAKITSSTLLKFRVEVERNISENDSNWKKVAGWRTRPNVERSWFEIVGRFEGRRVLVPVIVRRLSRPVMIVESAAWSHLMSNMSFTEFPSIVVPPEALTLDIKW